ncbi:MAG: DinB family protein [Planctomycetota bacterium]
MLSEAINSHLAVRGYSDQQLADLTDEEFFAQPAAGMNHVAWNLGHLAFYLDKPAGMLGAAVELGDWADRFAQGSTPTPGPAGYPSREEICTAFTSASDRCIAAIKAAPDDVLTAANTVAMKDALPTMADLMNFLLVGHCALHFGQVSAVRRALGRPPLF